jgi:2-methylcitrate dehydratase PrpD
MNETRELADFASTLTLGEIPERTRAHAKLLILDQLGCQIGSARLPWSQQVYQTITELGSSGRSVVMAMGDQVRADDAAFINSTFGAANEIDDAHTGVRTHAGAVVVPAAFAVAQAQGTTAGADLLLATIVGYEVMLRVAWAAFPTLMAKQHSAVTVGSFGAGAATAAIFGLDGPGMLNTLAIAGSHSSGLMEYTESGGSVKRIHTAIGSSSGVRSGYLARSGLTGPLAALEGRRGFLEAFADRGNTGRLTKDLGRTFLIDGVGPKSYFAEYRIHAPLQALEILTKEHGLGLADIESMRVGVTSVTMEAVGTIIEPADTLGAQFSMRFALALAAKYGPAALRDVTGDLLADPEVAALAAKVEMYIDPGLEPRKWETFGGVLSITTTDGRTCTLAQAEPLGSPRNPMSERQLREKFRMLAEPELGSARCGAIIDAVARLEEADLRSDLLPHVVGHQR